MANQREFTRVQSKLKVHLETEGRVIVGESRDVSLAGAFVRSGEALPEDMTCLCNIELIGGEVQISAHARVVRTVPGGLALRFEELVGLDSFMHLRELVRYNASDPLQVEREDATHIGIRRIEA